MRIVRLPAWLSVLPLLACLTTSAQTKPAASPCAHCHTEESLWQPDTQMARAMQIPGHNATLDAHPSLTYRLGAFTYTVTTSAGRTQYKVSDGTQSIVLPVLWTMGAEAPTWILTRDGKMYESLVSYYPAVNGLDLTTVSVRANHPAG